MLDAGTGLRGLGERLVAAGRPVALSVLFSHVHWDHIQGFPFFPALFRSGTELSLYGRPDEGSLESALRQQMTGPNFPVQLDAVPARLRYGSFEEGRPFAVGSAIVRAARLNHPNGVVAYRIEHEGRAVVYATDTEHYAERVDRSLISLAEGADLLIYDAQYTPEEYDGVIGGSRVGGPLDLGRGCAHRARGRCRLARPLPPRPVARRRGDRRHRARRPDRAARDGRRPRGARDPSGRPGAEQGGVSRRGIE